MTSARPGGGVGSDISDSKTLIFLNVGSTMLTTQFFLKTQFFPKYLIFWRWKKFHFSFLSHVHIFKRDNVEHLGHVPHYWCPNVLSISTGTFQTTKRLGKVKVVGFIIWLSHVSLEFPNKTQLSHHVKLQKKGKRKKTVVEDLKKNKNLLVQF